MANLAGRSSHHKAQNKEVIAISLVLPPAFTTLELRSEFCAAEV